VLKAIREFRKSLIITGFGNARIKNVADFLKAVSADKGAGVEVQFFDARLVATWEHLYFATLDALTAFKNEENISKTLAMETMLYASVQHQITKATELAGIKPTSTEIALLVIGNTGGEAKSALAAIQARIRGQADDGILEMSEEKAKAIKKAFGISDLELEAVRKGGEEEEKALVNLVIERMALLAAQH
jgi:tRNA threonylcarbamoyladenosine modification (KEOPS) complex Cgi121 subunit